MKKLRRITVSKEERIKANQELKEMLKWWKKLIRKNWGSRCEEFALSCCICQQYLALDILAENELIDHD